jgi:hypothetical protein
MRQLTKAKRFGYIEVMDKKKEKILVVCQHYWPETFRITDICEGLVENGYEVDVLCGIPNYPAAGFLKDIPTPKTAGRCAKA